MLSSSLGYIFHLGFIYRQVLCFVFAFVDRLFGFILFSLWYDLVGEGLAKTYRRGGRGRARGFEPCVIVQFSATLCKTQPAGIIAKKYSQIG